MDFWRVIQDGTIESVQMLCLQIAPWLEADIQMLDIHFHCWVCSQNTPQAAQMIREVIWEHSTREKPPNI